jgi:hypothetical protein
VCLRRFGIVDADTLEVTLEEKPLDPGSGPF